MGGESSHPLPLLNGASLLVVAASLVGATGLHTWRRKNGGATDSGQYFNDGGAIISIVVLIFMLVDMIHPMAPIEGLVRDNAILVFWAIFYAALMVSLNLINSTRGPS